MKRLLSFSSDEEHLATFNNVIIAGSRDFASEEHYALLKRTMDEFVAKNGRPVYIISGGARGADSLGERYAKENSIAVKHFIPDWDKYGKRAGMLRNKDMARNADALVVFWDGASRGTRNMIESAYNLRLEVVLVMYNKYNNAGPGIVSAHQQLLSPRKLI